MANTTEEPRSPLSPARPATTPSGEPVFAGPVKHSVTIAGHRTSISLEPLYWAALRHAADEDGIALNTLVARIDEARIEALMCAQQGDYPPANLASAIRSWLWMRNCRRDDVTPPNPSPE